MKSFNLKITMYLAIIVMVCMAVSRVSTAQAFDFNYNFNYKVNKIHYVSQDVSQNQKDNQNNSQKDKRNNEIATATSTPTPTPTPSPSITPIITTTTTPTVIKNTNSTNSTTSVSTKIASTTNNFAIFGGTDFHSNNYPSGGLDDKTALSLKILGLVSGFLGVLLVGSQALAGKMPSKLPRSLISSN